MGKMITVGEPQDVPIWGQDYVQFWPLLDTRTNEAFGNVMYRYYDDAVEAAARYNELLTNS